MRLLLLLALSSPAWAAPLPGRLMTHGTGDPIAGATLSVEGHSDVITEADGRFVINLPDGQYTVRIADPDHGLTTVELTLPFNKRQWTVFLPPARGPLEIVVESFKPSPHTSRHVVDAEQAFETPGTHDDAMRLVQSLPGVTVQREFSPSAGDISVRGSSPGDNRYFLDGVQIPYLYHFNQYASVFPSSQLEQLELFSSTFGAQYGDATGAVVEARSLATRPESTHGSVSFNTIMIGGDVRAPLPKDWWVSAAARRSYHDLAAKGSSQYTLWPIFYDFSVRAHHGDERQGTGLFVTGAGDRYGRAAGELDLLDPVEGEKTETFDLRQDFQVMGVQHRFAGAAYGRVVAAAVHHTREAELSSGGHEQYNLWDLSSRLDTTFSAGNNLDASVGYEMHMELGQVAVVDGGSAGGLVSAEAPLLARGASGTDSLRRLHGGLYAELAAVYGNLRLMPGLRTSFDDRAGGVRVEPRLAMRWHAFEQTEFKLAAGRYTQTPLTTDLLPTLGDPGLPLTDSWQVSVGLEQTIASRLEITLDGYAKWLNPVLLRPPEGVPIEGGQGTAVGAELVVRYRLRDTFFLSGWLGLARSRVQTVDGTWVPGAYDQPINLGLVASWDPSEHWTLGLRYRLGSGLPWTPVSYGLYDGTDDSWAPVYGPLHSERYPVYQKIDAMVTYRAIFKRWTLELRAEVWYVPKPGLQLYPTWNYDYSEQGWVRGVPFLPLIGARAVF